MLDDMGRACMNLLIEKFERIKEIDHDWAQTVYEERKQNTTPENKELVNAFNELFSTAREAYKKEQRKKSSICSIMQSCILTVNLQTSMMNLDFKP